MKVHGRPENFELSDITRTRGSALVDAGLPKTTLQEEFGIINVANLRKAHAAVEDGRGTGKSALSGF